MASPPHARPLLAALIALGVAGCGSGGSDPKDRTTTSAPVLGSRAERPQAAAELGFPAFATKNTTRVGGGDAIANAAAVAQAVFPSRSPETRPAAVVLVDRADWRAAISASQLMSRPLRAPVLFTDGGKVPPATQAALDALEPTGAKAAGGAQVLRIGGAAKPEGLDVRDVPGAGPPALARAIDALRSDAAGEKRPTGPVVVASADHPAFAMPAAGWAAKSGMPVLWTQGSTLPAETRAAIRAHGRPRIYVLGPESAVPQAAAAQLARLGRVRRIGAADAPRTAVAFARYADGSFGWKVVDPGHGFVFASPRRPEDAAAAAPLSASGTYGPLLLVSEPGRLDPPVESYLLDVQPGYDADPVRGVYNHGWLVGDESAISVDVQSRIDALLEIQPVDATQP
jgi:ell wall binding domain 2 (CWB2)